MHRLAPIPHPRVFAVAAGLTVLAAIPACLEPYSLAEPDPPPLADLGTADTWAPIADGGPPGGEAGPADGGDNPALRDVGLAEPLDPGLAQLRLTELLPDPDGKDGGVGAPEFVEIQNHGDSSVNLRGLVVEATSWPTVDADSLGLAGLALAPGAYLVIERWATDVDPELAEVSVDPAGIRVGFLHSGGLRNSDGSVELWAGAELVDSLEYGPETATGAVVSGQSLCLLGAPNPAWMTCPPTPGADSGVEGEDPRAPLVEPGALVIVEVSANPPGPSSEEKSFEYVELINASENPVELSGLLVGDDPSFDAPGVDPLTVLSGDGGCETPSCLMPGARALIVGQGYLGDTGDALVLGCDDTTIADGGLTNTEPVVLWRADGVAVSSHRLWDDPSSDPIALDEQPLHRLDVLVMDEPSSWVSAPPSPGQ